MSADPYLASGGVANPASWNRYAYVEGDPVNYIDPRGLYICNPAHCGSPAPQIPGGGGGGGSPMEQPSPQRPGEGGSDSEWILDEATPLHPNVRAARHRAMERIDEGCARTLGARTATEARTKLSGMRMGARDLGVLRIDTATNRSIGGPVARWNPVPLIGGAQFNMHVNWDNPDDTTGLDQNGNRITISLLKNNAYALGIDNMTREEFTELTLLHELAHSYGQDHPDGESGNYEASIWNDCFK